MKKFNFLIALGLMATASMQAQTTVARLGFEVGDEKYTTEGALTPGGTSIGKSLQLMTLSRESTASWQRTVQPQDRLGTVVSKSVTSPSRRTLLIV